MNWSALLSGILFGLGLVVSDMTNPKRVIGFLDITGSWDPALGFVMAAALLIHLPFLLVWKRNAPLFTPEFSPPPHLNVNKRLVLGAVIFGLGWGLAGFCPGPALVGFFSFESGVVAFVGAMLVGTFITRKALKTSRIDETYCS
jgi:hypothetical protein